MFVIADWSATLAGAVSAACSDEAVASAAAVLVSLCAAVLPPLPLPRPVRHTPLPAPPSTSLSSKTSCDFAGTSVSGRARRRGSWVSCRPGAP